MGNLNLILFLSIQILNFHLCWNQIPREGDLTKLEYVKAITFTVGRETAGPIPRPQVTCRRSHHCLVKSNITCFSDGVDPISPDFPPITWFCVSKDVPDNGDLADVKISCDPIDSAGYVRTGSCSLEYGISRKRDKRSVRDGWSTSAHVSLFILCGIFSLAAVCLLPLLCSWCCHKIRGDEGSGNGQEVAKRRYTPSRGFRTNMYRDNTYHGVGIADPNIQTYALNDDLTAPDGGGTSIRNDDGPGAGCGRDWEGTECHPKSDTDCTGVGSSHADSGGGHDSCPAADSCGVGDSGGGDSGGGGGDSGGCDCGGGGDGGGD